MKLFERPLCRFKFIFVLALHFYSYKTTLLCQTVDTSNFFFSLLVSPCCCVSAGQHVCQVFSNLPREMTDVASAPSTVEQFMKEPQTAFAGIATTARTLILPRCLVPVCIHITVNYIIVTSES